MANGRHIKPNKAAKHVNRLDPRSFGQCRGPDPETLPAFNSAAAQHLVLKGLAVLSCVAASAAAAAPRVVRRLGGMLVYGKDHEGSLVDR